MQIEYWYRFTYKLMWYDLYHVSNFTQNCMYRPYMYQKWWSWTNGFVLVLVQVELIQTDCSKRIRSILAKTNTNY